MKNKELFGLALGLTKPYYIERVEFKEGEEKGEKTLHIYIGFEKGSRFKSSDGGSYGCYDTRSRKWRHLDFFEHTCYLHCNVARVKKDDNKVEQVEVPWARKGSGFTLLFESYVLQLIEHEMPVNKVGKIVGENAERMWTILNYYVSKHYIEKDHSGIKKIALDETSTKKGHNYITSAVDYETRAIIHVVEGKSKESVAKIRSYLESKGCPSTQIEELCMDMSPSFIAGAKEEFPNASITFDRFHVKQLLNKAMDEVRKQERKEHDDLKHHKYTFLKNEENLSEEKKVLIKQFSKAYPNLGEAYRLKVLFDQFWNIEDRIMAELFLEEWCLQANKTMIQPFVHFASTLKKHWNGILNYINSKLNNGILEGLNFKFQLAKRRARGFRKLENFITIIYLIAGKLDIKYPHKYL